MWLLRIDDIDTHRSVGGSEQTILESLLTHGMQWDEPISWQSKHSQAYEQALTSLAERDQLFFCNCSRRSLKDQPTYPGSCRANLATPKQLRSYLEESGERSHAIRIRVPNSSVVVTDELQDPDATAQQSASGDYVVFRRDGLVSYQLAVVVDDILTGVNRVVRGADLLATTARQQQLHEWLGNKSPAWLHLPVLLNQGNTKLSKQAHSQPIDNAQPSVNLAIALQLLGQNPPNHASSMAPSELTRWASEHWQPEHLPREQTFSTFIGW